MNWADGDEDGLISINYTSGTTGQPKGVMCSHHGAYLQSLGVALEMSLDNESRYLCTAHVPLQRVVLHLVDHRCGRFTRVETGRW